MCHYARMASDRVRELKALLDRLAERAEFHGGPTAEDQILREEVIGDFNVGVLQEHRGQVHPRRAGPLRDTGDHRLRRHLGARPVSASS